METPESSVEEPNEVPSAGARMVQDSDTALNTGITANIEPIPRADEGTTNAEQAESSGIPQKQPLIRLLTFEALKAIESASSLENSLLKKAKSNLTDLIAKSLAQNLSRDFHHHHQNHAKGGPGGLNQSFGSSLGINIVNKDRYKTELCRKFMENSSCPYSKKCQFAHGYHELKPVARHPRYRTELCREFFNHGLCTYGTRCNFIHQLPDDDEEDGANSTDNDGKAAKGDLSKDATQLADADDVADDVIILGCISSVDGSSGERPYTPSNDSGLSFSLDTPANSGRYSPIESTRLSERSESPSELIVIREVLEEDGSEEQVVG